MVSGEQEFRDDEKLNKAMDDIASNPMLSIEERTERYQKLAEPIIEASQCKSTQKE